MVNILWFSRRFGPRRFQKTYRQKKFFPLFYLFPAQICDKILQNRVSFRKNAFSYKNPFLICRHEPENAKLDVSRDFEGNPVDPFGREYLLGSDFACRLYLFLTKNLACGQSWSLINIRVRMDQRDSPRNPSGGISLIHSYVNIYYAGWLKIRDSGNLVNMWQRPFFSLPASLSYARLLCYSCRSFLMDQRESLRDPSRGISLIHFSCRSLGALP